MTHMLHRLPVGTVLVACASAYAAPDLVVSDLNDPMHVVGADGFHAYAFAIQTCNLGDAPAAWNSNNAQHPVATQNLFRIVNGRIEHIGLSFAWHGFSALAQNGCGLGCSPSTPISTLGAGCSTPDNFLGSPNSQGPRSQVNAATGQVPVFPASNQCNGPLCERIFASEADLSVPGAVYIAETNIVHFEDAAGDNNANNASTRQVLFAAPSFNATFAATTQNQAAIYAWRDHGLGANMPDASIQIHEIDIPGDGLVIVGSRAVNIGGGVWRYTYAVENISSHLSIGSFNVPMGADPEPGNAQFRDVEYHSGEIYDNTDWDLVLADATIRWQSPQTFAENPNSNAIRWATLYTFSIDVAALPADGAVVLGMFRAGGPDSVDAPAAVPSSIFCPSDINADGLTDFSDLNTILGDYGQSGPEQASDIDGDGDIDFADLNLVLGQYGQNC